MLSKGVRLKMSASAVIEEESGIGKALEEIKELEAKFDKERDLTARHIYFLHHTVNPQEDMRDRVMRAKWGKIFRDENVLLDELCYRNIKVEVGDVVTPFRDMEGGQSAMTSKYVSGKLVNLTPSAMASLHFLNKKVNASFQDVVDYVMTKNNGK